MSLLIGNIFELTTPNGQLPVRGTPDSAGVDVFFYTDTLFCDGFLPDGSPKYVQMERINPHETRLLRSGIKLKQPLPSGLYLQMSLRSSWRKKGLSSNGVGIIDGDYPDEIFHLVSNTTPHVIDILHGDRLSQLVVLKHETDILNCTIINNERVGGFGSTGK